MSTSVETDVEYFGQIAGVRIPREFHKQFVEGHNKAFSFYLNMEQIKQLGLQCLAVASHAERHRHQQKKRVKIRTKIKPVNQGMVTIHNCGSITVMARQIKKP